MAKPSSVDILDWMEAQSACLASEPMWSALVGYLLIVRFGLIYTYDIFAGKLNGVTIRAL